MNKNIKTYIKTNAFLKYSFIIDESIGELYCPSICTLGKELSYYHYLVNEYVDLFDDGNIYQTIISNEEHIQNFTLLIQYFKDCDKVKFKSNKFYIIKYQKDKQDIYNFIDESNIDLFMETIKTLHHLDKTTDDYKPANKIAEEMLRKARERRKKLYKEIKKKDGIGFLDIMSSVSCRHPSINPLNIDQLNYYQIIELYKRLLKIDDYTIQTNALAAGMLDKDAQKKIEHYSKEIKSE